MEDEEVQEWGDVGLKERDAKARERAVEHRRLRARTWAAARVWRSSHPRWRRRRKKGQTSKRVGEDGGLDEREGGGVQAAASKDVGGNSEGVEIVTFSVSKSHRPWRPVVGAVGGLDEREGGGAQVAMGKGVGGPSEGVEVVASSLSRGFLSLRSSSRIRTRRSTGSLRCGRRRIYGGGQLKLSAAPDFLVVVEP